ncbi:PDZK1-interacting protein 1 isoform X1 [Sander lucioperca]|uniref:PDZK1-interacting protein 1 isoform X1 n=1 Tax=Sander lucioperca TaxID=283035 RepID=UPI00125D4AA1|nr:PDZK1-interacting protein 1 isoform X1 [Sander lucioperca]
MGKLCELISCLLLSVSVVTAQTAQTGTSERLLPQWLTGLIAVTGFLFLTFVVLLVQKAWCEEPITRKSAVESVRRDDVDGNAYETSLDMVRRKSAVESVRRDDVDGNAYEVLDMVRSKEDENAYENLAMDGPEDKVTSM